MKLRRSIRGASLAVIILTLWLVGCGGETPTASPAPTEPAGTALPEEIAPAETPEPEPTELIEEGTVEAEPSEEAEETAPAPAETPAVPPAEPTEESTTLPPEAGLTAVIVAGDTAGTGKPFTFDATQSQAGEAPIVNYVWNMGDGTTLFGLSVQHAYRESGFYTVTLTVTDADGQTDTAAKVVEVRDDLVQATPTLAGEFTLVGTEWRMNNAVRGTTVTLAFGDDSLNGSAGCNTYSAAYATTQVDDMIFDISVETINSTGDMCTLEVMGQETGYLESLASARRVTVEGDTLTLETGSGTLTFNRLPG